MRRMTITTCVKCGKRMKIAVPVYTHPLHKLLKQLAPSICEACRMRRKMPQRRL